MLGGNLGSLSYGDVSVMHGVLGVVLFDFLLKYVHGIITVEVVYGRSVILTSLFLDRINLSG